MALGLVVTGSFEMMDDRLHSEKDIRKLLPADVIVEIPAIENAIDLEQTRKKMWLGWATAVFVFTTIALGSAFSFLRG